MKSFFEEYGFVLLSAIVVIALITIASQLQGSVKTDIDAVMTGFKNHIVEETGNLKSVS